MSGAKIAEEVASAIADASAQLGGGTALTASLWRALGDAEATYPPAALVRLEFEAAALILKNEQRASGDGITATGDVELMLAAEQAFATEPQVGDHLYVTSDHFAENSRKFVLNSVDAKDYGGVTLMWKVTATERGQE